MAVRVPDGTPVGPITLPAPGVFQTKKTPTLPTVPVAFVATDLRRVIGRRRNLDNDEENIAVKCMKLTTAVEKCITGEIEDCKTVAALLAYAKRSDLKMNMP